MESNKNIKFSSLKLYHNHSDIFQKPHFNTETARLASSMRVELFYIEMSDLEGRQQHVMK